jgi:hypothetical protein
VIAVLILLHVGAGWGALWAHYGFRYAASPNPTDPTLVAQVQPYRDAVPQPLVSIMRWLKRYHLVPEGFRRGINSLLGSDDENEAFMNGEWRIGGRWDFFPYAIWVKTPPAVFVLLLLGAATWWTSRTGLNRSSAGVPRPYSYVYATTPCLALVACYLSVAMAEDLNIGHRHVLPIYPALYIFAGAAASAWQQRPRWFKLSVALSLGWLVVDSVAIRPHYLAYFGPQAGGPREGYKRLVDSSLDWGMDLPGLRQWLDVHNPGAKVPLFLAYFGSDSVQYYGIQCRRLPGFFDRREVEPYALTPGYYAISASLLQSIDTAAYGPWSRNYEGRYREAAANIRRFEATAANPREREALFQRTSRQFWVDEIDAYDVLRFSRLCAWLRHRGNPPHNVGHSIFVWKLGYDDLKAALLDPPVELTDAPPPPRRIGRFAAFRD